MVDPDERLDAAVARLAEEPRARGRTAHAEPAATNSYRTVDDDLRGLATAFVARMEPPQAVPVLRVRPVEPVRFSWFSRRRTRAKAGDPNDALVAARVWPVMIRAVESYRDSGSASFRELRRRVIGVSTEGHYVFSEQTCGTCVHGHAADVARQSAVCSHEPLLLSSLPDEPSLVEQLAAFLESRTAGGAIGLPIPSLRTDATTQQRIAAETAARAVVERKAQLEAMPEVMADAMAVALR